MRTKTMAVAVVAIFVLPLIGIAQVASTEIKTYTSEEHDYSIDLPADCLFVDSGAPYAKHYDEPDIRCHSLKNRVAISVYFSKLDSENEEGEGGTSLLQRFVDAEIDRYGKEYHSVYKTYKTSTDAGEEVIVAQLKIGRLSKENRYFLKKDHETACIIICRAGAGIYEKTNQEVLEPMIRSFKFTGEPTPTPVQEEHSFYHSSITYIDLNGQGDYLKVKPGEMFRITTECIAWAEGDFIGRTLYISNRLG